MKKILKKENIFYLFILILFVALTTVISLKHEYWADEAQAWLVSRDLNIFNMITNYLHTEGHPLLFYSFIKLFQFCGLNYTNYHFISILFSSLGVAILLFKSNLKWYLKILLPFTYFIFYQYTVITRGYCLILLLLSLIATIWDKKNEKSFLYTLLLILLLSLESYTFLIAGSLFLLWIIEYIKDYKKNKRHNSKLLICFGILFLSFLLTTIYIFPRSSDLATSSIISLSIADSFIYSETLNKAFSLLFNILIITFIIYLYLKKTNKQKILELLIICLPVYLFFRFYYSNYWHAGIFFILFIFISWIHNLSKEKVFNAFLLFTCLVQIFWSIKSSINDYKYIYAPGSEIKELVETYDYKQLKIYGNAYNTVIINPFFKDNLYTDWYHNYSFYYLNKKNPNIEINYDKEEILKLNPDILIYFNNNKNDLNLEESYNLYSFVGKPMFKDYKLKELEYNVYIKKDIDK